MWNHLFNYDKRKNNSEGDFLVKIDPKLPLWQEEWEERADG